MTHPHPLPEPYAVHELWGQNVDVYDARQMHAHAAQAVAAERERWRASLESAWIEGYYDAGYTHDSAYAQQQAAECAGKLIAFNEPAAGCEA